jgi:hypothetical protein
MGTDSIDYMVEQDGAITDNGFVLVSGSAPTLTAATPDYYTSSEKSFLYRKSILRNTPSSFWISWNMKSGGNAARKPMNGIAITIGEVRHVFNIDWTSSGADTAYFEYATNDDTPVSKGNFSAPAATSDRILAVNFKSNGDIDIYHSTNQYIVAVDEYLSEYNYPTGLTLLASAIQASAWNAAGIGSAKMTAIDFFSLDVSGTGTSTQIFYALYVEADSPTPAGGTATIGDIVDTYCIRKLGGGGAATLVEGIDLNQSLTTIRANQRKSVDILDTTYGIHMFSGEIERISVNRGQVTYILEEASRKTTKQNVGFDPVVFISNVARTKDNIIYDEFAGWTINAYQNLLIVTRDNDLYSITIFPYAVGSPIETPDTGGKSNWRTRTPDNTGGSAEYLYFYDPTHTNDVIGYHFTNSLGDPDWAIRFPLLFTLWQKTSTVWDNITLKTNIRFTSLRSSKTAQVGNGDYGILWIYNYDTSSWDDLYHWHRDNHSDANVESEEQWHTAAIEAADGDAGKSPIFQDEFDLLDLTSKDYATFKNDHMTEVIAENSSGFKQFGMQIRIEGPAVGSLFQEPKIEIHYMEITFDQQQTKNKSQGQQRSSALIASNTAKTITISEVALADQLESDGLTKPDEYSITSDIETVLARIATDGDKVTSFSIETDFDGDYSLFGETEDLTTTSIYDYLQKISSAMNFAWWYLPSLAGAGTLKIADNFDSTGLTLIINDIVDYDKGAFSVEFSAEKMRDKVTAIGDEGITKVLDSSDYTPDYSNTLGVEEITYRDIELYTQKNVDSLATSKKLLVSAEHVRITLTLNFDNPRQDYSTIDIGKTIHVNIPEYDSTGDQELLIDSIEYRRRKGANKHSQRVTISMHRRQL